MFALFCARKRAIGPANGTFRAIDGSNALFARARVRICMHMPVFSVLVLDARPSDAEFGRFRVPDRPDERPPVPDISNTRPRSGVSPSAFWASAPMVRLFCRLPFSALSPNP